MQSGTAHLDPEQQTATKQMETARLCVIISHPNVTNEQMFSA